MTEAFDARWGGVLKNLPEESLNEQLGNYFIMHIVFLFVMFCLLRPPFLTIQTNTVDLPTLSLSKVLFFSIFAGSITYVWYCYAQKKPIQSLYQEWMQSRS